MLKINTYELESGMVLADDVVSIRTGVILIPKGTILNKKSIRKIYNRGIKFVYIYDKDDISNNLEKDKLEIKYEILSDKLDNVFTDVKIGKKIILTEINDEIDDLIDEIIDNNNILAIIRELEEKDDYTFNHSLNVSMLTTMLGKWLGYSQKKIKQLTIAGLFHDIGKLKIDENIINKPGKLTDIEFEEIKKHTIYGYNILKETVGISKNVSLAVLQHHEREDGSGYPLGLKKNEIHEYAKIIAICDTYDAMTSNRVYKPKKSPFFAAEILRDEGFNILNPKMTKIFLDKIAGFYVGCTVLLSNGEEGDIIYIHPQAPTKAIVKLGDEFIDFLKPQDLEIVDIIK